MTQLVRAYVVTDAFSVVNSHATMAYATATLKTLRLLSSPQIEAISVPPIVWRDLTYLWLGQQPYLDQIALKIAYFERRLVAVSGP